MAIATRPTPDDRNERMTTPVDSPPPSRLVAAAPVATVSPASVTWTDPLLASLSILCGLLERPMSSEALKTGLPLAEGGFTPELFIRAAARAGLSARLVRRRLDQISKLSLPCVVLLKNGGACVLTKLSPGEDAEVILPESGTGAHRAPLSELKAEATGYVLFAKPEFRFDARADEAEPEPRGSWFWGTVGRLWQVYIHVVIASVVINLFALASPLFVMNVYDRVVPNNALETLWVLAIGVVVVFGFDFLLRTVRSYFVDAAGKSADVVLASRLFEHVLGMRCENRPPSTGALASNLREYESLREFFTSATMVALVDLPFVFLFIGAVWLVAGTQVALVPLVAVPVVVLVGLVLQWPLKRVVEKTLREASQKHAILVESIEGLDTIKIAGAEGRAQRNWERFVAMTAVSAKSARLLSTLAVNFTQLAQNVVSALVVVSGVFVIADGSLTVGGLVAATILTGRAMAPLSQVAALIARLHMSLASLKALNRLMKTPLERPPNRAFLHRPGLRGQIELRDVNFTYPNQKVAALTGVSIFIGAGEKVGIIGRIGSGKSTIGRLVTGLYRPIDGSILLDGVDLRQLDPADLRRNIGFVPQDSFLFFGSVKENIAIGMPHIDDQAILRAAAIAGVDDFLKRQPQGFDLQVGERGQYLSGGQREAITIARALLYDPPILLMDEPTGAMDNASENRLKARLQQIIPGKTLVLVTHRSSMLPLVDRLIVMDGGRVVADGPKDKVLESLSQGQVRVAANH